MTTDAAAPDALKPPGACPGLILPDPTHVFLGRSRRFTALAEGNSLADWLAFLGRLTLAQHELLQGYPPLPLPDENALTFARKQHLAPISVSSWPRDPCWQQGLICLARELAPHAPGPARATLARIQTLDGKTLEALAERVLLGELGGQDADFLPFVAAALQVHWTAIAARLDQTQIAPPAAPGACPCCDFLPVTGVVRMDGDINRQRYLHCGLCNTQWHLVRVTCAACGDSNRIAYYHIEGSDGSIRAETCDACRRYLKNIHRDKSPQADPVADDLATLALDLLVDEAGYERMSPNLLFAPCRDGALRKRD